MKKLLASLLVLLLVVTGCSTSGPKLSDSYTGLYGTDIESLNYLTTMRATNGDHLANFIDGLLENTPTGEYVGAMAESWEVSADGLVYTYKIREGVKWVTSAGEEYADVTAHDWVTGLKHAADEQSDALYIAASVVGLADYAEGVTTDFATVGVKAVDDYTLEYTLNAPEPFWNTKLTYGIMFPLNAAWLDSKGADFGTPTPDSILYNGPYVLANNTAKSVIEYTKNEAYWDLDNVYINTVKFEYTDGKNPDEQVTFFENEKIDSARVFPNSAAYPEVAKNFEGKITNSLTLGSTFNINFNYARRSFVNSDKTPEQQADTQKAMLNKDFRKAFQFAFDRPAYQAQNVGDDNKLIAIRNSLTPPQFITIGDKNFGDYELEELIKLDPAWEGKSLADGQDAFKDDARAKKHLEAAKATLEADGVSFPIILDLPIDGTAEIGLNRVKSLKASVEAALGAENVVINIVTLSNDDYMNTGYYAMTAAAKDYDISNASGWGPDYVDASTYLNIYNSKTGDMLDTIGIDSAVAVKTAGGVDGSADAREALKLSEYDALLAAADAIKDDVDARAKAYAVAAAWLNDAALQIPVNAGGGVPRITKVVPFTAPYAWNGLQDTRYKYVKVQEEPVTVEQFEAAQKEWEAARAK